VDEKLFKSLSEYQKFLIIEILRRKFKPYLSNKDFSLFQIKDFMALFEKL